ncbi:MAG TPA: hypothetical protein VMS37_10585 [Verrucomicrobiae bacterium]|nr:hypothetical protein [Verrucomicrobiae bacterium]
MLDSTATVAAERQGKNARQLLETVVLETGDEEIALSVITGSNSLMGSLVPIPLRVANAGNAFWMIC